MDEIAKNALRSLRDALSDCRRESAKLDELKTEFWKQLAGPDFESMIQSKEETRRRLLHPDPRLRCVAIIMLAQHWKVNDDTRLAGELERISFNDSDPQVRAIAFSSLGCYYGNTSDPRIGKLLASVVRDEHVPTAVRNSAYSALFTLRGLSGIWKGDLEEPPTDFHFPQDVDWQFVDSFLDPNSTYQPVDPLDSLRPPHTHDD